MKGRTFLTVLLTYQQHCYLKICVSRVVWAVIKTRYENVIFIAILTQIIFSDDLA